MQRKGARSPDGSAFRFSGVWFPSFSGWRAKIVADDFAKPRIVCGLSFESCLHFAERTNHV